MFIKKVDDVTKNCTKLTRYIFLWYKNRKKLREIGKKLCFNNFVNFVNFFNVHLINCMMNCICNSNKIEL